MKVAFDERRIAVRFQYEWHDGSGRWFRRYGNACCSCANRIERIHVKERRPCRAVASAFLQRIRGRTDAKRTDHTPSGVLHRRPPLFADFAASGRPGVGPGPGCVDIAPDHEARALFRRVADAYKALDSYSDEGQFVVAMTLGGKPRREARPLRLTFIRPNKIDLDAGAVRLISDGKTLTTLVRPLKKYTTAPAPATIGVDTFREGPTGPLLFGGPTAAPTFLLLNLLMRAPTPTPCSTRWAARLAHRGDDSHPDRPSGRARPAPPRRPGRPDCSRPSS